MKYYIATSLSRAKDHNTVRDHLQAIGHEITYDWTPIENAKHSTKEFLREISQNELEGVTSADILVMLLPGGFGTHVELGAALASDKKIIIHSYDPAYFSLGDQTNAFYYHPSVSHILCPFESAPELIGEQIATVVAMA